MEFNLFCRDIKPPPPSWWDVFNNDFTLGTITFSIQRESRFLSASFTNPAISSPLLNKIKSSRVDLIRFDSSRDELSQFKNQIKNRIKNRTKIQSKIESNQIELNKIKSN